MHVFFSLVQQINQVGAIDDDPCPITVLKLTNLGQSKKFLMHPIIPVHYPVTGQMHLLYKPQSHKCSQCYIKSLIWNLFVFWGGYNT